MKKILAIVLALVMVCTLAMAATTGTASMATVEVKGWTLYNLDEDGVFVKDTATLTSIVKNTHGNDVEDDGTVTYYADVYKVNDSYYFACDKTLADAKLVKGSETIYLCKNTDATEADFWVTTTLVVDKKVAAAEKPVCGDYVDDDDKGIDVYMVDGVAYLTEGDDVALLNGKFVAIGDEAEDVVEHTFNAADYTYKATDNAGHNKVVAVKCDTCKNTYKVVDKLDKDFAGTYDATTLAGQFIILTAGTTTTTTTNPDTGANDVIGVAAALAVVALVSGAAISLKK